MNRRKYSQIKRIADKFVRLNADDYPLVLGYMIGRREADADHRVKLRRKDKSA